jgi:hypothetical protein
MSALLASIGPPRVHWMEFGAPIANRAMRFVATMENFHDLGQTRIIVRIFDLELLKGVFGHGGYPRDKYVTFQREIQHEPRLPEQRGNRHFTLRLLNHGHPVSQCPNVPLVSLEIRVAHKP